MIRHLLAAACVAAVLAGSGAARADSTLVIGIAADPTGLDPEAVLNNTSGFVMATIYDSLVKYKPGTVEPKPGGLAQSWTVSDDGLTYRFKLRSGVTFQDGTPFNADTYIEGIKRLLDKSSPISIYNTGPVESYIDFTYGDVASLDKVDDHTVAFRLKKPDAPFVTSLAMVWNGVVSPTAAAKYGKDFRNHPVGTGPFIFREWRPRDSITLDANPTYWGGKPHVDHLIFKEYPDPQAALLALKQGDIQILGDVSTTVIPALRADKSIRLLTQPGLATSGMGMPTDTPPFDNVKVRQALNFAIDRNAIDKALFQGFAVPMVSPLPAAEWGYQPQQPRYTYNPTLAKRLLAEAGVKTPLSIEFLTYNSPRGYNPAGADLAVAIQGYLKKIGIDAEVRKLDMGAFLASVRGGKYKGLFMVGWTGDNGDPDNFVCELYTPRNPANDTTHYNNPVVNRLCDQGLATSDHAKRVATYQQIQQLVWQGAPWVFVNSVEQVRAIRTDVHGYQLNPTQMFFDMEKVSVGK
jgi:peptide/nickel transport system substrate-binding protein